MLKLTTKRKQWFNVPNDPTGEAQVEILHLKPGEVADIEAKSNSVTGKQMGEDFMTEIDFRLNERTKKYLTSAVVNWKGFCDMNDKPLKCTDKNILEVHKEFDWFAEFVEESRTALAEQIEDEMEGAEKN